MSRWVKVSRERRFAGKFLAALGDLSVGVRGSAGGIHHAGVVI